MARCLYPNEYSKCVEGQFFQQEFLVERNNKFVTSATLTCSLIHKPLDVVEKELDKFGLPFKLSPLNAYKNSIQHVEAQPVPNRGVSSIIEDKK